VPDAQDEAELIEQAGRPGLRQFTEVDAENAAVQERKGRAGLYECREGLGCGLDDVFEEMGHFRQAELGRMPFVVEENERTRPRDESVGGWLGVAALTRGLLEPFK
jgi:hypothetical protein